MGRTIRERIQALQARVPASTTVTPTIPLYHPTERRPLMRRIDTLPVYSPNHPQRDGGPLLALYDGTCADMVSVIYHTLPPIGRKSDGSPIYDFESLPIRAIVNYRDYLGSGSTNRDRHDIMAA